MEAAKEIQDPCLLKFLLLTQHHTIRKRPFSFQLLPLKGKSWSICLMPNFCGGCTMDWCLSCLSQVVNRPRVSVPIVKEQRWHFGMAVTIAPCSSAQYRVNCQYLHLLASPGVERVGPSIHCPSFSKGCPKTGFSITTLGF